MADTFTGTLNLCKPEIDQSAETWGQKLNADLDLLDQHATTVNANIAQQDARIQALITYNFPRGTIILWYGNINAPPPGWLLCNGTLGTPNLHDRFVLGNAGGRTQGEMGGSFGSNVATDVQGHHAHGGVTTPTAITTAQMPSHTHDGWTDNQGWHDHGYAIHNQSYYGVQGGNAPVDTQWAGNINYATAGNGTHSHNTYDLPVGGDQGHTHGVYGEGNHQHNVSVSIVPPYLALAYIMRA